MSKENLAFKQLPQAISDLSDQDKEVTINNRFS